MLSRDAGHNRVPAPPHMMTGMIVDVLIGKMKFQLFNVQHSVFHTPENHAGANCYRPQ